MNQTRLWTVGAAVAAVVVLLAGWFGLVSPQRGDAAQHRADAQAQVDANAQLQTQIDVLKQEQKGLPAQQSKLAALRTQIPDNPALPNLIRALSDEAQKSGVVLTTLTPSTPVTLADTSGAVATTTGTSVTPDALAYIPLQVQLTGDYFEIEQFMGALERMQRSFLVSALTIAQDDSTTSTTTTSTTSSDPTLTASITGRVFMVPPAPVVTVPTTGTATTVPTTTTTTAPTTGTATTTAPTTGTTTTQP
jgi:Tfp pilus assembly protein PilO